MTNFNDTNTNKNSSGNTKFLSELRGASIIVTIVLISLLALSVGLYAYMQKTPPKHVIIDDQMDLFTSSELDEIEELANEMAEASLIDARNSLLDELEDQMRNLLNAFISSISKRIRSNLLKLKSRPISQ